MLCGPWLWPCTAWDGDWTQVWGHTGAACGFGSGVPGARPPVHEVEGRAGSGLTQPVLWDRQSRRGLSVAGMPLKPLSLGPLIY